MNIRWLAVPLLCLVAALPLLPAQEKKRHVPDVLFTPQSALDLALADARAIAKAGGNPAYYRYLSCYFATSKEELQNLYELTSFTTNSLNFKSVARCLPERVDPEGRLLRIDVHKLTLDLKALDQLGKVGSGPAPFPEWAFHQTVIVDEAKEEEVEEKVELERKFYKGYEWVRPKGEDWILANEYKGPKTRKVKKPTGVKKATEVVGQASWLAKDKALELVELTGTQFALFRADWFIYYSLLPPSYYLFQGDPQNLADFQKLAGLDEKAVEKIRATQLRAIVLFSEVANHNRILQRSPTPTNYGRGAFWETSDFFTSIRNDDLLKNVLNQRRDASELIWTNPNGTSAYALLNGQNARIDFADPRVATDGRSKLQEKTLWSARNCIACHSEGYIPISDEVRLSNKGFIGFLAADKKLREKFSKEELAKIEDQYFGEEIGALLLADQLAYGKVVKEITNKAAPAISLALQDLNWRYIDQPVEIEDVAVSTGYPVATCRAVIEEQGKLQLDHTFVRMLIGRRARKDQLEASFSELMRLLVLTKVDEGPKKP